MISIKMPTGFRWVLYKEIIVENVNTNLEELFNTLFPTDGLEPEGFCIDARKLHQALEVKSRFNDWIKQRLKMTNFLENIDYSIATGQTVSTDKLGKFKKSLRIDYNLTLEMAKHFCMLENTPVGYQVRTYFIQAEKALRTLEPELTEEIQSKILGYNQFLDSSNTYSMAEAAQLLGTGRTRLMKELRSKSYLKANNTPYQKSIETGYMITKIVPTRVGVITVARVTARGLDHLRQKL